MGEKIGLNELARCEVWEQNPLWLKARSRTEDLRRAGTLHFIQGDT